MTDDEVKEKILRIAGNVRAAVQTELQYGVHAETNTKSNSTLLFWHGYISACNKIMNDLFPAPAGERNCPLCGERITPPQEHNCTRVGAVNYR